MEVALDERLAVQRLLIQLSTDCGESLEDARAEAKQEVERLLKQNDVASWKRLMTQVQARPSRTAQTAADSARAPAPPPLQTLDNPGKPQTAAAPAPPLLQTLDNPGKPQTAAAPAPPPLRTLDSSCNGSTKLLARSFCSGKRLAEVASREGASKRMRKGVSGQSYFNHAAPPGIRARPQSETQLESLSHAQPRLITLNQTNGSAGDDLHQASEAEQAASEAEGFKKAMIQRPQKAK
jgi:hypothetical protein